MKTLCLVGNRFNAFSNENAIITVNELLAVINDIANQQHIRETIRVIVGQGVSDADLQLLDSLLIEHQLAELVMIESAQGKRAASCLSHKHHSYNTLISDPEQLQDKRFMSYLMIDDACAEMSDHVTGQHIQGMVLVEAARQMTIAVTEKFFIADSHLVGFTTDKLETVFQRYVFPVPCLMDYEIKAHRSLGNNARFNVVVGFYQNDQLCTEVKYQFSTFDRAFLKQKESQLAADSYQELIAPPLKRVG